MKPMPKDRPRFETPEDTEIRKLRARIAELEAAIDKLIQCKGRYHTEANFKALIEVHNKTLHK